jgi:hypothetical protein
MNRYGCLPEFGAWFRRCLDKTQDGNDAVSLVTKKGATQRRDKELAATPDAGQKQ